MNGYMGKILRVDLTSGKLWDEPLNEDYCRAFIGGSGLAARLIYDMVDAHTDPLGPENPLIFMTGPLVGTTVPSSGRCSVCAISPLTRIWGEANTGGFIGSEMKFAGYDGIIIVGQAAKPVWISLVEGKAELHDATEVWGADSYATQEWVRKAMGDATARVACIGVAGENQVKLAAVMNDHGRAAARGGLGAVMGAKKVKAIGLRGSARVPLADSAALQSVTREILVAVEDDIAAQGYRLAGTAFGWDTFTMYGNLPIRYYQQGEWDKAPNLSGVLITEQYLNKRTACYRCPIACGRQTRAPTYGIAKVDGPEYETLAALGSLIMVDNLEDVIYAGHLCNVYGMDTISVGSTIALACEMFERGILTTATTGGLEMRYGDAKMAQRLIEMIARREGFGSVLAEGSASLAEKYGIPELAVVVNRLEAPMYDPRAFSGMAVSFALSPRGACHMEGDMYSVDLGMGPAVELGIEPGDRFDSSEEKGRTAARQQAWRNLYNSLILCQFQNPGVDKVLTALGSVTGWSVEVRDLMTLGKRIVTLKRMLNMRLGLTKAADRLPSAFLQPLKDGGTEGHVPDVSRMLLGAYAEFGWDAETGRPDRKTLDDLGLSFCL